MYNIHSMTPRAICNLSTKIGPPISIAAVYKSAISNFIFTKEDAYISIFSSNSFN